MGKLGSFARFALFFGFGMFLAGIAAGFAGLFLQSSDIALIALAPLIAGGLLGFTGVAVTIATEARRKPVTP